MVFPVKLIYTAASVREREEVQMEKCLAGDTGVEVVQGGRSGLADADSNVFLYVYASVCMCVRR